jgi:hypothetical protein
MNMRTTNSKWKGESGVVYEFADYTLDTVFNDNKTGNYIFSRRCKEGDKEVLYPVYIGEGIIKERIPFRINEGRVQKKGCNCISVRFLNEKDDSKQIEEDLLAAYSSSYEPNGCNIKQGG